MIFLDIFFSGGHLLGTSFIFRLENVFVQMLHNRKFQPQGSKFFGSYKQVFTVSEFVVNAFLMQLDYKIAPADCYLQTFKFCKQISSL